MQRIQIQGNAKNNAADEKGARTQKTTSITAITSGKVKRYRKKQKIPTSNRYKRRVEKARNLGSIGGQRLSESSAMTKEKTLEIIDREKGAKYSGGS